MKEKISYFYILILFFSLVCPEPSHAADSLNVIFGDISITIIDFILDFKYAFLIGIGVLLTMNWINKGFAVPTLLYGIIILVIFLSATNAVSNVKTDIEKAKKKTVNITNDNSK